MGLKKLQYGATEDTLGARLRNVMDSLSRIFRKAVAEEGFNAGPIKLKNTDLNRVHGIVSEIDSRRVFYTFIEDERPEFARKSVNETRAALRSTAKGMWANSSEERIIQEIQRALANFETACDRIQPFPRNHHSPKFNNFVDALVDMRMMVWSLIGFLKQKNGDVIQPLNMPEEIMSAVSKAGLP